MPVTPAPYLIFKTEAESKEWRKKFGAENAKRSRAPGVNLDTYEPPSALEFTCTSDFKARLYPLPNSPHFYILDFIDNSGTRSNANLHVYPYTYLGPDYGELEPMRDLSGCQIYFLPPHACYDICAPKRQKLVSLSFLCKDTNTVEPIFHN